MSTKLFKHISNVSKHLEQLYANNEKSKERNRISKYELYIDFLVILLFAKEKMFVRGKYVKSEDNNQKKKNKQEVAFFDEIWDSLYKDGEMPILSKQRFLSVQNLIGKIQSSGVDEDYIVLFDEVLELLEMQEESRGKISVIGKSLSESVISMILHYTVNGGESIYIPCPGLINRLFSYCSIQTNAPDGFSNCTIQIDEPDRLMYTLGKMYARIHNLDSINIKEKDPLDRLNIATPGIISQRQNQYKMIVCYPRQQGYNANYKTSMPSATDYLDELLDILSEHGVMIAFLPQTLVSGQGDHYRKIRKNLIESRHLETVIPLPNEIDGINSIIIMRKNINAREVRFFKTEEEAMENLSFVWNDYFKKERTVSSYLSVSKDMLRFNDYSLDGRIYMKPDEEDCNESATVKLSTLANDISTTEVCCDKIRQVCSEDLGDSIKNFYLSAWDVSEKNVTDPFRISELEKQIRVCKEEKEKLETVRGDRNEELSRLGEEIEKNNDERREKLYMFRDMIAISPGQIEDGQMAQIEASTNDYLTHVNMLIDENKKRFARENDIKAEIIELENKIDELKTQYCSYTTELDSILSRQFTVIRQPALFLTKSCKNIRFVYITDASPEMPVYTDMDSILALSVNNDFSWGNIRYPERYIVQRICEYNASKSNGDEQSADGSCSVIDIDIPILEKMDDLTVSRYVNQKFSESYPSDILPTKVRKRIYELETEVKRNKYTVVHNFNSITMLAKYIIEDSDDNRIIEQASAIRMNALRTLNTVAYNILGEEEPVEIASLIKSFYHQNTPQADFKFEEPYIEQCCNERIIRLNPQDLNKALNHILDNAKRHGFLNEDRMDYWFKITLTLEGGWINIDCTNNGEPISVDRDQFADPTTGYGVTGQRTATGGAFIASMVSFFGGEWDILRSNGNEDYSGIRMRFKIEQ